MNETNHPARRLRHGDRPTEPLVFEDAAANKAAEEGEPTDAELAQEVLLEDLEAIANYWDGTEVEDVIWNIVDIGKDLRKKFAALKFPAIAADRASRPQSYSYEQAHQYAKEAVQADRASRQVANKAEVEPVAYLHDVVCGGSGEPDQALSFAPDNFPLAGTLGFISVGCTPLYATPPETTGASTGLLAAIEALFWEFEKGAAPFTVKAALNQLEEDGVEVSIDPKNAREIFAAAGLLEGSVGASTVLTDERIKELHVEAFANTAPHERQNAAIRLGRAIEREVAAQAGQVAVPEWEPIETAPKTGRTLLLGCFNEMGNWRTMRGQWFTKADIDQDWEETDGFEAGWYETAVEPDFPNCWEISPTHWMELPAAPSPAKESK